MKRLLLILALLVLPVGMAGPSAAQLPLDSPASEIPVFRVGDAIRVAAWRLPDLSGTFEIGEDGTIIHPLLRTVRVAGLSVPQAEREVSVVLRQFEADPQFVIEPLFRVGIGGEVHAPNIYTLPPQMSVAQAVVQAGGATPRAELSRARLLREGREIHVDLTRPHSELAHLRVRSGDQIILDRRRHIWRDGVAPVITALGSLSSIAWLVISITR